MNKNAVGIAWQEAAADLEIEVVAPFQLLRPDGTSQEFEALVKHFGRPLGTVIDLLTFDGDDRFWELSSIADMEGYYYSQLNPEGYGTYKRYSFIDTLIDWGWADRHTDPPVWYKEAIEKKRINRVAGAISGPGPHTTGHAGPHPAVPSEF